MNQMLRESLDEEMSCAQIEHDKEQHANQPISALGFPIHTEFVGIGHSEPEPF